MANNKAASASASVRPSQLFNKVKPPYNINQLTQKAALQALDQQNQQQVWVEEILNQRSLVEQALTRLDYVEKVYPSDANFLLVEFEDPKKIYTELMAKGIVVRDRSSQVSNTLRITIGTVEENQRLIAALKEESYQPTGRIGRCVRETSETKINIEHEMIASPSIWPAAMAPMKLGRVLTKWCSHDLFPSLTAPFMFGKADLSPIYIVLVISSQRKEGTISRSTRQWQRKHQLFLIVIVELVFGLRPHSCKS